MSINQQFYSQPLNIATPAEKVEYLKKVLAWTTGGLFISAISGMAMSTFLYVASSALPFLLSSWVSLIIIFGCYGIAHFVAPKMVFGRAKMLGFLTGAVFQGLAMGYLLLAAVTIGIQSGNPFGLVISALTLTGATGVGMTAYVYTTPREFKGLGAFLSATFIPMLLLMAVGFVFPGLFGGVLGMLLCGVFVLISAAGLLYQLNAVINQLNNDQHIEGSYMITMGVLVLFWNILSLLMHMRE